VELFEIKDRAKRHRGDFSKFGIFHFCLDSDDFQGVIDKISLKEDRVKQLP